MHFVQTRIATIDTYAVFFILLMYDAILVSCKPTSWPTAGKRFCRRSFLSGLFMGLGVASKWTVAYGAVGLAVLFFGKTRFHLPRARAFVALRQKARRNTGRLLAEGAQNLPVVLPVLHFDPVLRVLRGVSAADASAAQPLRRARALFAYQTHMYNYHSTLQATHTH